MAENFFQVDLTKSVRSFGPRLRVVNLRVGTREIQKVGFDACFEGVIQNFTAPSESSYNQIPKINFVFLPLQNLVGR